MKQRIGILLALILLMSALPICTMAAEIGYVSLNVTSPGVNAAPQFQATCNHDNYVVDTAYKGSTNGVFWYDATDAKEMNASDRFVEGHAYEVSVVLTPTSGNKFALDTGVGVRSAVSGAINDSSAKVTLSGESMLKIMVSYTFILPTKLTSVSVTDIIAPVSGQKPEYDGMVTEDGYTLKSGKFGNFQNGVYWFDCTTSALLSDTDVFTEGHQYRVFLCLSATEAYTFQTDLKGNPNLEAYVNGNAAKTMKYLQESSDALINVYYDFPPCVKPEISAVNIGNLPVPQAGKSPQYTADIKSEGLAFADTNNTFSKNGITWSHKVKGYDLTPTGFFFGGHTYIATMRLDVKEGYSLSNTITVAVNGSPATATVSGGQVIVQYEVMCPEYKIDKVDIVGVTAPAIGTMPAEEMQCAEPNLYVIKDVSWYVDDALMGENDKFVAGKNYDLVVYVDRKQEDWDYVAAFGDKVSVTVNGKNVSDKKVERIGDSVMFTYTFTAAASAKIGAVDIIGIDAPVAGMSPDYTASLINEATYKIDTSLADRHTSNGITWRNVTEGNAMAAGAEKFEKGNVYEVMVTVTPHDGYTFITGADGTPAIEGTINGETATDIMGRSDVEAIIVYKFAVAGEASGGEPKEEPENKNDKPSETDKPAVTDKSTETDTPTETDKPSTEKPQQGTDVQDGEKIAFTDIKKDAYYYTPVIWAVENGITTGTGAYTFSPDGSSTRAQVVTFLHRMLGSPEPANIEVPFLDVKEGSYYYKAVKWAVGSKITGGTSATTFSPDDGCTRAQVVTFLWRTAGQPKSGTNQNPFLDVNADSYYYDAVLWAVENGITSGTSATTFSPDTICTRAQIVTFLYRFINE